MFFLFLVQNTIHDAFPGSVLPFLLAGVIFFALTEGPIFGAVLGCFAGFLLDVLGVGKLGGSMALFSLAGIIAGFSSTKIFYDSLFTQSLLPVFCQYLICAVSLFFVKRLPQGEGADLGILKEALFLSQPWFTVVVSLGVFSFLKKVANPRHARPIVWNAR